jgi:hypothetical protein
MTTIRLLTERSRNAIAALAALGLVTVIAVVAAGLALAGVHAGSDAGAQRVLAHSAARSAAVRVTTHLADDAADQESAARALVSRVFPAGTVDVHTAWNTLPTAVTGAASDLPVRGVFAVRPDLLDLASITDGEWPADEDSGAALQEDAAEALGLGVGDEFTTGTGADEVRLTVEALWRATDPADPVWFADPLAGSGRAGEAVGPLVVGADVFAVLPTQRFVTWIITATPAALAAGDRAGVAEAIRRLPAAVETSDGVEHDSSEVDGGLGSTLAAIASAQRGAVSVATSALTIVALLSLVALAQLSRVVAGARRRHTGLLRARGLSLSQLAAVTALEGVIVGALGAVVGAGVVISVVGTDTLGALALIAVAAIGATVACLLAVVIAATAPPRGSRPAPSLPCPSSSPAASSPRRPVSRRGGCSRRDRPPRPAPTPWRPPHPPSRSSRAPRSALCCSSRRARPSLERSPAPGGRPPCSPPVGSRCAPPTISCPCSPSR